MIDSFVFRLAPSLLIRQRVRFRPSVVVNAYVP